MRKEYFLPGLALTGGIVAFFLRRWELATAFEPETGLHIHGSPATWAVLALSVFMAGLLLFLCSGSHSGFPGGYDQAFHSSDTLSATVSIAAGFLLGLGGILTFIWMPDSSATYSGMFLNGVISRVPRLLLSILCLISAVCVIVDARGGYRGKNRGKGNPLLLAPAYACCMWLISAYQSRAADPVLVDYVYELLGIIAILMALYEIAGFSFEKAKVKRTAYFALLGIYLSVLNLADGDDLGAMALFAFAILYLSGAVTTLLTNDRRLLTAGPDNAFPETEESPEGGNS